MLQATNLLHAELYSLTFEAEACLNKIKNSVRTLCQSRFGFRIPNTQSFEIDRKLDILVTALVYMMIEGGVIKAFIVAPCFIKR
jgi:hypothetical protein